jgi:ABC-type nitrate/sulfonate/bicarbonate transport system ATPase subunit
MRQRVAFLRPLLASKPVLLLDEPFASLDAITRAEMQEWLAQALATEPATAIVVTHDVEEALYLCDRVAVLSPRPGRILGVVRSPAPRRLPRLETVTSPQFGTVRERALELLAGGTP